MLKTVIKHYLVDIGLGAMFDNMVENFVVDETFYDKYKNVMSKKVIVLLSADCIQGRNLAADAVSGIVVNVTEDSIKIALSQVSIDALGWDGHIYLYKEDIYKLYS